MVRSTQGFSFEQTPEQRKWSERMRRMDEKRGRLGCRMLETWSQCEKPVCRRSRDCRGDPEACFLAHWSEVPDDEKEYIRGMIQVRAETRDPQALHRAGLARREVYLKLTAGVPLREALASLRRESEPS